ncbi:hypothetical protein CHUAL_013205 [Chamberlinius hualienensis]
MQHYIRRHRSRMQFHPRISNHNYEISNPSETNVNSGITKVIGISHRSRQNEVQTNCPEDIQLQTETEPPVIRDGAISTTSAATDQLHSLTVCMCQMSARPTPVQANLPLNSFELDVSPGLNQPPIANDAIPYVTDSFKDNPPPYHVAVNLPCPLSLEAPPPPYENAPAAAELSG